jgi:hypothetical protein
MRPRHYPNFVANSPLGLTNLSRVILMISGDFVYKLTKLHFISAQRTKDLEPITTYLFVAHEQGLEPITSRSIYEKSMSHCCLSVRGALSLSRAEV